MLTEIELIGKDDPLSVRTKAAMTQSCVLDMTPHWLRSGFMSWLSQCDYWIQFPFHRLYNPPIPCYLDDYPT